MEALKAIPPEYLCGGPVILVGLLAFFCSSHEWYWEAMNGHWQRWNTPAGRLFTKFMAVIGILGGIGIVTGIIPA